MTLMITALIAFLLALTVGVSFLRGYRAQGAGETSRGGWYGLGLLALLFAGLWGSGRSGNEPAAYGFGIAIALAVPAMAVVGIAGALGRFMRKRKHAASPD